MKMRKAIRSLWCKSQPRAERRDRPAVARRAAAMWEPLERRDLLTAAFSLSAGHLQITSDPAGGTIEVSDVDFYNHSPTFPSLMVVSKSAGGDSVRFFSKSGLSRITVTGSNKPDVLKVNAGYANLGSGNTTTTPIQVTIQGRGGFDVLQGGFGPDRLIGGWGPDFLFGMDGNDTLIGDEPDQNYTHSGATIATSTSYARGDNDWLVGGNGVDVIYGGGGNDTLLGGAGADMLYGNHGHDVIRGEGGNDKLYGQVGDDRLYGGNGNDELWGHQGNDGLYGGSGLNTLASGGGADRFLLTTGSGSGTNTVTDFSATDDTRVTFVNGSTTDVKMGSNVGWVRTSPGHWTSSEIEKMDEAFSMLVTMTGNNRLLETSSGQELSLTRYGLLFNLMVNQDGTKSVVGFETSVWAWNRGSNTLAFANNGMNQTTTLVHYTLFHEIGHNWDESAENESFVGEFRQVGGWEDFAGKTVPSGHEQADDDHWSSWYFDNHDVGLDRFASTYGKMNPKEDFAESFAAYVATENGVRFMEEPLHLTQTRLSERFAVLDDFFASLA